MPRDAAYWLDRFPKSRRPSYPTFRGQIDTDVVIVGGGLTGCACAASFASAGMRVAVLEADRLGTGATAAAPGLVREDFDASFQAAASAHGLRAARSLWQAMRRASLDFAAALRRHDVRCDLAPQDLLSIVPRDATAVRLLRREYDARRQAGLDHSWLTAAALARETALEAGAAIRTRGFVLDPYPRCSRVRRRCRLGAQAGAALRAQRREAHSRESQARRGHDRQRRAAGAGRDRRDQRAAAGSPRAAPSHPPAAQLRRRHRRPSRRGPPRAGHACRRHARRRVAAARPPLAERGSRRSSAAPIRGRCPSAPAIGCWCSARAN